jgi:TatD DNase family protein
MLIDSHSHLDFEQFDIDREEMLQRAVQQGVGRMISIGTSDITSQNALDLSLKHDFIYASAGVHPMHSAEAQDWEKICEIAKHPRVVAIGETGLDFYHNNDPAFIDQQRSYFAKHFELSNALKKPIIVHSRGEAFDEIFEMTRKYGISASGVIHCFIGTAQNAFDAIDLGYYVSISGVITYKNNDILRQAVAQIPLDKILVETDCPYLAPVPQRGKRNEPAFVNYTAQEIAKVKKISVEEVAYQTTLNCHKLFHIPI